MRLLILSFIASLLLALSVNPAAQSPSVVTAFTHINVVDVVNGQVLQNRTVVVRNRFIERIEPADRALVPAGAALIDGSHKFLIPGLWDAHVHTRYAGIDHLRLLIAHGITSARDLGGGWEHLRIINNWITEIDEGKRIGPRIIAAGVVLDGPTSSWSHPELISTPEQGRAAVERLRAEGARYVKVYVRLSRPSFEAIVDEARRQELPVGGHVVPSVGVFEGITLGQSAIEHAADLLVPLSATEEQIREAARLGRPVPLTQVLSSLSSEKAEKLGRHFRSRNTRLVPTLSLYAHQRHVSRAEIFRFQSTELRFIPPGYLREWRTSKPSPPEIAQARFDGAMLVTKMMIQAGAEILAGTDVVKPFFVPGNSLHDELTLLVEAGLTPLQALRAATVAPANYLGIRDAGTIAAKQRADLVLLDANPLLEINNTRKIAGVMANGAYYSRKALDEMLREVERDAATWNGTPTGQ